MATTRIISMHVNQGKTIADCLTDRIDYSKKDAGRRADLRLRMRPENRRRGVSLLQAAVPDRHRAGAAA